jgi:hypothetical protein
LHVIDELTGHQFYAFLPQSLSGHEMSPDCRFPPGK